MRKKQLQDEESIRNQFKEVEVINYQLELVICCLPPPKNVCFLLIKELEGRASSDESSSDDEHTWQEEQRKELKQPTKKTEKTQNIPKFYEVKQNTQFKTIGTSNKSTIKPNK